MFCVLPTAAQLSRRLDRCPSYPTLADEIGDMHQEVESEMAALAGPRSAPTTIAIEEVKFDGPIRLRDSVREQLVARLKASGFEANSRWLDEVQDGWIRGAWQDEGFFKVNPTARVQIVGSDSTVQHALLTVHVDEGLQYTLGSVRFRSADPDDPLVFSVEQLRGLIPMRDGDIFSAEKIRGALDAMKELYGSNGYIDFVVTPITDIGDDHPRISLTIEIDQQKQFRLGKIEIFSSNPAIEPLLRSKLHAGDIFNSQLIQSLMTENKTSLPPDVSLADVDLHRDVRNGTADLRF
jgi:outer membrane protein assembly factor BamA